MKKMSLSVLVLTIISCISFVNSGYAGVKESVKRFEAEKGTYSKLLFQKDSSASGGEYLRMGNEGDVSWNVQIEKQGWYDLIIRYRAPEGEKEELIVRNGFTIPVGFQMSENWNLCRTQTFLKKGINQIQFKKSWGNIDIDYLEALQAKVRPEMSPKNNIFYKEHPESITFKISKYGYKLNSVSCEGRVLQYDVSEFTDFEDAVNVTISGNSLLKLSEGKHKIIFKLNAGAELTCNLMVKNSRKAAALNIVAPDVEHGSSVIITLPGGKILLVDCGKSWVRDQILIPMLDRHNIKNIDYMILTHYHGDHDSDDKGEKIRNMYHVKNFYDYKSFAAGDTFELEGVKFKVLNSYNDGTEENSRSMSFKMEYNGFVYVHGADTYADNQAKILKNFPEDIKADVFYANHHFHGSVNTDYLRTVDPYIVLLQAEKAIYARSAYMVGFRKTVAPYLIENKKHFIEILPCLEVGTVVVRVNGKNDWTYETYRDTKAVTIPYLFK